MTIEYRDVVSLLESPELAQVEDGIASRAGYDVCRDNLVGNANYSLAEISLSGLNTDEIANLLRDSLDDLIAFGVRFLADEKATSEEQEFPAGEEQDDDGDTIETHGLGVGFGVTYAIYWHFLENCTAKEFAEYLKKRRIGGPRKFATELRQIHQELTS